MSSEIQICNLALTDIGANRISSLSEASKAARECSLLYPVCRDEVLEDHDWNFARKRLLLALLTTTYSGWTYAYGYPTDCIKARKIYNANDVAGGTFYNSANDTYVHGGTVEFEVITNATNDARVIATNKANAELIYTSKITDTNLYSSKFILALAKRLASALAIPIKGKASLHNNALNEYLLLIESAKESSSNEGYKKQTDVGSFVRARYQ